MKKLTERNVGISSDDDMIDITTSGTMTEHTLNQRSPINLPGNIIMFNSGSLTFYFTRLLGC